MKVENMPRNVREELQERICQNCNGTVWNVKGKCAHPEMKIEHPNPIMDNRCLKNS
jgi:hypothetical protein